MQPLCTYNSSFLAEKGFSLGSPRSGQPWQHTGEQMLEVDLSESKTEDGLPLLVSVQGAPSKAPTLEV